MDPDPDSDPDPASAAAPPLSVFPFFHFLICPDLGGGL